MQMLLLQHSLAREAVAPYETVGLVLISCLIACFATIPSLVRSRKQDGWMHPSGVRCV